MKFVHTNQQEAAAGFQEPDKNRQPDDARIRLLRDNVLPRSRRSTAAGTRSGRVLRCWRASSSARSCRSPPVPASARPVRAAPGRASLAGTPSWCRMPPESRTRMIAMAPPLDAVVAGEVNKFPLLPSGRATGPPPRAPAAGPRAPAGKTLLRWPLIRRSRPHMSNRTAFKHPGVDGISNTVHPIGISNTVRAFGVLPSHGEPWRRRTQVVRSLHPLPRRHLGGFPSCI